MHKVLFVCLGNICRSPAAEAIFFDMALQKGLEVEVDSCAVGTWNLGHPPHPMIVNACEKRGHSINNQRKARLILPIDFEKYDLILAVERSVKEELLSMAPNSSKHKIELLTAFSKRFHNQDIQDPYNGKEEEFDRVVEMAEDSCEGLIKKL